MNDLIESDPKSTHENGNFFSNKMLTFKKVLIASLEHQITVRNYSILHSNDPLNLAFVLTYNF